MSRNAKGQVGHNQFIQTQIKDFARKNDQLELERKVQEEKRGWTLQVKKKKQQSKTPNGQEQVKTDGKLGTPQDGQQSPSPGSPGKQETIMVDIGTFKKQFEET